MIEASLNRSSRYRGRLAPSPTGLMHLGHACTFWKAQERARAQAGTLVLRNEDLDRARCKPEYVRAMLEDLRWFGLEWQEGPDCGGFLGPYSQSERQVRYKRAFEELRMRGFIYPCACSRRDVLRALGAPHASEEEPVYPGTCRPGATEEARRGLETSRASNWRFRVTNGERVTFVDGRAGPQEFEAGKDFGDFVIWRHDDVPAYQLAVVVDDSAMQISEVVRGEDLLLSTARQLLIYRALNLTPPAFYHAPLITDNSGVRLAKRHDALSLRSLRNAGLRPAQLRQSFIDVRGYSA